MTPGLCTVALGGNYTTQRQAPRHPIVVPARLIWKDARGTTRLTTVRTHNVSNYGAFVECLSGSAIPLYRLVELQIDPFIRSRSDLPPSFRQSRVLAAVYRVGPCQQATGAPASYALRLLVKPDRRRRAPADPAVRGRETRIATTSSSMTA